MYKRMISCIVMFVAVSLWTSVAQSAIVVGIPSSGIGNWTQGVGSQIDFGGGDTQLSVSSGSAFGITFLADDCCIAGDQFALVLDGIDTPWSSTDWNGTNGGTNLFQGFYTATLSAGTHTFGLNLIAAAPDWSTGSMNWSITAVPEPEIFGMMLAGLSLVGFMVRRRKNNEA
jgi:hypothetical protein